METGFRGEKNLKPERDAEPRRELIRPLMFLHLHGYHGENHFLRLRHVAVTERKDADFKWAPRGQLIRHLMSTAPGHVPGVRLNYGAVGFSCVSGAILCLTGRGRQQHVPDERTHLVQRRLCLRHLQKIKSCSFYCLKRDIFFSSFHDNTSTISDATLIREMKDVLSVRGHGDVDALLYT